MNSIPERTAMGRPTFNWEINFGHVMTIATLLGAGFLAYLSIEIRIADIDRRTFDYSQIRDQVKADGIVITNLTSLTNNSTTANRALVDTLASIREDVAVIKATLAAERARSRLPPQ